MARLTPIQVFLPRLFPHFPTDTSLLYNLCQMHFVLLRQVVENDIRSYFLPAQDAFAKWLETSIIQHPRIHGHCIPTRLIPLAKGCWPNSLLQMNRDDTTYYEYPAGFVHLPQ